MLLGQNVNSYGNDFTNKARTTAPSPTGEGWGEVSRANSHSPLHFPKLLEDIAKLKGNFWIRFTSPHPKDMSDELLDIIAKYPKICKNVHLPVQAGDDLVLKNMNRHYTIEHYKKLVKKIREKIPNVSISTDVIVGFCGETKKQFQNTMKLFKDVGFSMAYISQYSTRPGTVAAKNLKDDVTKQEKVRRENELNKILAQTALKFNQQFLNKEIIVLVDQYNEKKKINLGKNEQNVTAKIPGTKSLVGQFVKVKITGIDNWGMMGK